MSSLANTAFETRQTRQLNLALLTPGSFIECHGPELLNLCDELERQDLRAVAMTRKGPAHYPVTVGEGMNAHAYRAGRTAAPTPGKESFQPRRGTGYQQTPTCHHEPLEERSPIASTTTQNHEQNP